MQINLEATKTTEDLTWAGNQALNQSSDQQNSGIPKKLYDEIVAGNYNFDLNRHGIPKKCDDIRQLIQDILLAKSKIKSSEPTACLMGCGPGRLAISAIEIARLSGFKHLIFNDLLAHHIKSTREIINATYGVDDLIDGLKIEYISGDYVEISNQITNRIDALFANWFVTPEMGDFSSNISFHNSRQTVYKAIYSTMRNGGVFIEEVPDVDQESAYYKNHQIATARVLTDLNFLSPDIRKQLLLSDFRVPTTAQFEEKDACTFHLRATPNLKTKQELVIPTGFKQLQVSTRALPSGIIQGQQTEYLETISNENLIALLRQHNTVKILKILDNLNRRSTTFKPITQLQFSQTLTWHKSN